jgi:alpha-L-arabinofuranosidase
MATGLCGIAAFLVLAVSARAAEQRPAGLVVHVDRPAAKISPLLYGIFFEEINRAGEGGIYGEMIQNRSLEDDRGPRDERPTKLPAWTLLKPPGAEATMALDSSEPLAAENPHSLRLEIRNTGGGRVAVANEGFNGIALQKNAQYAFSLYARAGHGLQGPLAVSVEDRQGRVFASSEIDGLGPQWKQFACRLKATGSTAAGRLVLAATSPGTLWLDSVSLFPQPAWKGRAHGLRPDLAEMLAGMKPAFVRFPGGCYVEGNRLANAFRWKQSIGDPARRPGHWNLWGYRSTDGLGYHEYLEMCEDLGAEPLFVINCGMAHEDHVPAADMALWVQDALDAIEYANGPAESRWGALRAKAGHPAPFNLKYMEIGNENGGPVYQDHYRLFYDAIKAKHPQMHLVANERTTGRPTEILDEHYYSNPEFFMSRAAQYDKYDRRGPRIYVGEYAVTERCGHGNLRAALGEAAFMTGLERNADVVVMASYAPLLVNAGWRQWNPDAIIFDNHRVAGTPSYYVQQMFSRGRGDVVLDLDFDAPETALPAKGGAIGVGTWATQAEYKDIQVTQGDKVLFKSRFADGQKGTVPFSPDENRDSPQVSPRPTLSGWKIIRGRWQVTDGALRQTSGETDVRAIAGDKSWKDYTLTLKARKLGGAEGFLILFNVQNEEAKSWWNIGGWGNVRHAIEAPYGGSEGVPGRIETGRWYDIRIETAGGRTRCYLDGKLIHDAGCGLKSMYAVASRALPAGDVILKVVNASPEAHQTPVELRGLKGRVTSATASVLTSPGADDENTLDEPLKVVPATRPVAGAAAHFSYTFPAWSVTVLRVKVESR